eukprot:11219949-Lingulodinium_polyedra.AAC.1
MLRIARAATASSTGAREPSLLQEACRPTRHWRKKSGGRDREETLAAGWPAAACGARGLLPLPANLRAGGRPSR